MHQDADVTQHTVHMAPAQLQLLLLYSYPSRVLSCLRVLSWVESMYLLSGAPPRLAWSPDRLWCASVSLGLRPCAASPRSLAGERFRVRFVRFVFRVCPVLG